MMKSVEAETLPNGAGLIQVFSTGLLEVISSRRREMWRIWDLYRLP